MSLVLLGILNAQAGEGAFTYWLSVGGLSGGTDIIVKGHPIDSADNSYVWFRHNDISYLSKYDNLGELLFSKSYNGGTGGDTALSIVTDGSGNFYTNSKVVDSAYSDDTTQVIVKYDSDGAVSWERGQYRNRSMDTFEIETDGSNVYLSGVSQIASFQGSLTHIIKYNSSGTLQWQLKYGSDPDGLYFWRNAIDSSGNLLIFGVQEVSSPSFGYYSAMTKLNSAGTIQWQVNLQNLSTSEGWDDAVCDSSDNIYIVGSTTYTGSNGMVVAKYNSSGTLQWQRTLSGDIWDSSSYRIAKDSSDNIYIVGDQGVCKYNSSGTIQWQRKLTSATGYVFLRAIEIDANDDLRIAGYTAATSDADADLIMLKLPNDGSLTGTYTVDTIDFVYAAATGTDAAGGLTAGTFSKSISTGDITTFTPNYTKGTTTYTVDVTGMG